MPGAGRIGLGLDQSYSGSKPFSGFSQGPAVSPYLNLFRVDQNGFQGFNYSTLVQPQLRQQQLNQQQQSQNQHDDTPAASNFGASGLQRAGLQGRVSHRPPDGVPVYGPLLSAAAAACEKEGTVALLALSELLALISSLRHTECAYYRRYGSSCVEAACFAKSTAAHLFFNLFCHSRNIFFALAWNQPATEFCARPRFFAARKVPCPTPAFYEWVVSLRQFWSSRRLVVRRSHGVKLRPGSFCPMACCRC